MPFNTLSVASAVTPSVIETYFSHYLNRGPLKHKPTAHISYHEGLRLIRQFLDYSSRHGVEDLQAFTAQWVPAPTWVKIYVNEIAPQFLERAAKAVQAQLGRRGLEKVGGPTWWQWRRPESPLKGEWVEMKKDFNDRKRQGIKCDRCILYVHGGAYYFGSVDEHRYQMQRHARKLKARILAPRYRLAPQYPFPCGLYDCIATYLYLLEHFRPDQILFAGDSAGGGMVLSMLVILRDQGFPLPSGTILLSPWVDLTHSFPSVAGDGAGDYIPPHGFHHKPSMAWPPPPSDELPTRARKTFEQPSSDAVELPATEEDGGREGKPKEKPAVHNRLPGLGENLSITVDGERIEIKEQIQLYTPNDLLSHPLVSPVMQPSLGGLPPMLIQVGGGELLRDEQIYLAHKAANPKAFPPSDAVMSEYDPRREYLDRYPPTDVQLQVWEDLCHVPHTLSFTRPAKYMYRSVAQFGAWALAHAQHKSVELPDNDDALSIISSGPEEDAEGSNATNVRKGKTKASLETNGHAETADKLSLGAVGRAGDPLPPFKDHMIRQRVTRHGMIYPLASQSEMACLALDPASIGAIKPGPVRKWLAKKKENEVKFGNEKRKVQKKRAKELAVGYDEIQGEYPPPTALVGRRTRGVAPEEKKKGKSWGLAMWSGWGSHHDEDTLDREQKLQDADGRQGSAVQQVSGRNGSRKENVPPPSATGTNEMSGVPPPTSSENGVVDGTTNKKRRTSSVSLFSAPWSQKEVLGQRSRSPYRQLTSFGQSSRSPAGGRASPRPDQASIRTPYSRRSSTSTGVLGSRPVSIAVPTAGSLAPESLQIPGSQNTYLDPNSSRPHNGTSAYPFKLRTPASNPSLATLDSQGGSSSIVASEQRNGEGEGGHMLPVEMPTTTNEPVEMPTPADERSERSQPAASEQPHQPHADAPASAVSAASNAGSPALDPDAAISPVSPADDRTPTADYFKPPAGIFDNRSSVLGAIGADGMPITPMSAKRNTKDKAKARSPAVTIPEASPATSPTTAQQEGASGETTPVTPIDAQMKAAFKLRGAVDPRPPSQAGTDSTPVTPVDGDGKSAPFKIRNPVFDARATTPVPSTPGAAAVQQNAVDEKPSPEQLTALPAPPKAGEATEATKAAPFKLRHTVVDPSAGFGGTVPPRPAEPALPTTSAIDATKSDGAPAPGNGLSNAESVANRAMTPVEPPAASEVPPNANVVMPTVVARRPLAMKQDTPPEPPRKEDNRNMLKAAMDRKRSRELLKGGQKPAVVPTSKTSGAPMIGDFGFESGGGLDFTGEQRRRS